MKKIGKFKEFNGITLIALVVTIIILLILAGVVIRITVGENGLFNKAKQASRDYNIDEAKEQFEIILTEKQINFYKENAKMPNLQELADILCDDETERIEYVEIQSRLQGKLDRVNIGQAQAIYVKLTQYDYEFKIDNNIKIAEINETEISDNKVANNTDFAIFRGYTYFDSNIQQTELLKNNNEFTIATSVFINRIQQASTAYMCILGDHADTQGFAWQFNSTSTELLFIVNNNISMKVDYTPYYDKWTNIVMTYNNSSIKVYINGQLATTGSNMPLSPYNKINIGTGFTVENRTFKGAIKRVKIWNKELSENSIKNISYEQKDSVIEKDFILSEINFDNTETMTLVGTNYEYVPNGKEIVEETKFIGGNYLNINVPQTDLLANGEFSIAARVKINRAEQSSMSSMGIFGNHTATSGITWQFEYSSTILHMGYATNGKYLGFDFTPYYDKYVDIVETYKDSTITTYIDGVQLAQVTDAPSTANGELYVADSWENTSRGMKGYLAYAKIWNKALNPQQVSSLNMEKETNIEKTNLMKEMDLTDFRNFSKYGTLANTNIQVTLSYK